MSPTLSVDAAALPVPASVSVSVSADELVHLEDRQQHREARSAITNRPITTIMQRAEQADEGGQDAVQLPLLASAAARSSMASRSPLDSPLEIRWMVIGGKKAALPATADRQRPRAPAAAASTDGVTHRQVRDHLAGDAQASSTGTAAAGEDAEGAGEARRVEAPRTSRPTTGRSSSAVEAAPRPRAHAASGEEQAAEYQRDHQPDAPVAQEVAEADQHRVSNGSVPLPVLEHLTTFGTT
jgi:hypothetical protein